MRYWLGAASIAVGIFLIWSAVAQKRRVLATGAEAGPVHSSLQGMGETFRPLILVALAYFGVKTSLVYAAVDGGQVFSIFDLAGFLFLLTAYGVWISFKTTYREAGRRTLLQRGRERWEGLRRHEFGNARRGRGAAHSGDRAGTGGMGIEVRPQGDAARGRS